MTDLPRTADFVVVGAGIVGLALALEVRRRHPSAGVVVLEKEPRPGAHQSGRNSGVLHAGFYYAADSLKARLCRDGNRRMQEWCAEHGVAVQRCGKLVVARDGTEHAALDELLGRARRNGVPLEPVDDARAVEPHAAPGARALWSPTTAVVDPTAVMTRMAEVARQSGIVIASGAEWKSPSPRKGEAASIVAQTTAGTISAGFLVNAAGLHADRVARAYGFARDLAILPVKGRYLHGNAAAPPLRTHVYPVPDLAMPFLGVHLTLRAHGGIKIGPTASPAPWREAYAALDRFSLRDVAESVAIGTRLFAANPAFRGHVRGEVAKLLRHTLVRHAAALVPALAPSQFDRWGRSGIRAQLVDLRRRTLVMDFHHESDANSLHVLNAVSPAFTCALAFAAHLAERIP
jgi:L-2-hydroxyglutarate oxidase LhgO